MYKQLEVAGDSLHDEYILAGCAASHVGNVRKNNEDNYILSKRMNEKARNEQTDEVYIAQCMGKWNCVGVFDGMGGGEKGEVASNIAATEVLHAVEKMEAYAAERQVDEAVQGAFQRANNAVVEIQKMSNVYGTTGTVCCMDGCRFRIYHLGDSRAYLFREGCLYQLTKDQTVAQMKIDAGFYTKDDPRVEMEMHQLTEYIGYDWTKENLCPVESEWMELKSGDRILLCSDGLYDMCTECQIDAILKENEKSNEAAEALVAAALENGGRDNVTCVIVKVTVKKNT